MDEATPKLLRCVQMGLGLPAGLTAASVAASEVDAEASAEGIVVDSGAVSIVVLAVAAVLSVRVIVDSEARPTLLAALALHLAQHTAAGLTVTATTTEEVVDLDGATMIDPAVGTGVAVAVAVVVSTDLDLVATTSHSVLATATEATVVVGIATEATMTAEEAMTTAEETTAEGTTHASVRMMAARATRESASCVDTNCDKTIGLVVGILRLLVRLNLSRFDTKGKQKKPKFSRNTLDHSSTTVCLPHLR